MPRAPLHLTGPEQRPPGGGGGRVRGTTGVDGECPRAGEHEARERADQRQVELVPVGQKEAVAQMNRPDRHHHLQDEQARGDRRVCTEQQEEPAAELEHTRHDRKGIRRVEAKLTEVVGRAGQPSASPYRKQLLSAVRDEHGREHQPENGRTVRGERRVFGVSVQHP